MVEFGKHQTCSFESCELQSLQDLKSCDPSVRPSFCAVKERAFHLRIWDVLDLVHLGGVESIEAIKCLTCGNWSYQGLPPIVVPDFWFTPCDQLKRPYEWLQGLGCCTSCLPIAVLKYYVALIRWLMSGQEPLLVCQAPLLLQMLSRPSARRK